MTTPQPPEEVFCMTCGPDALLQRDPRVPVLHCPHCADSVRVPSLPLFVVTGASGAGRTTVTGPLRRLLPDCDVFEADLTFETAIPEHQRFASWLRVNIEPSWDTSVLTPGEAAENIAAWVRRLLAEDRG
jgi:hypothetical protein